jgi:hypothetical protein
VTKVLRGAADCAPCFEVEEENCKDPQCLSGVSVDMVVDVVRGLTRCEVVAGYGRVVAGSRPVRNGQTGQGQGF